MLGLRYDSDLTFLLNKIIVFLEFLVVRRLNIIRKVASFNILHYYRKLKCIDLMELLICRKMSICLIGEEEKYFHAVIQL